MKIVTQRVVDATPYKGTASYLTLCFYQIVVSLFNFNTLADSHVKFYAWIIGLDDFFAFDSLFSIEITSIYQHQCKYE